MGRLTFSMQMSLDGYMAGAAGELDFHLVDEELHRHFNEQERATDLLLYGRRLYELMAGAWPAALDDDASLPDYMREYAEIWMAKPKVVFSRSLERVEWNSRLVRTDPAAEVARLKAQAGQLSIGGAEIAADLGRHGLIDEYRVYVTPVLIGTGRPMFPPSEASWIPLRLLDSTKFSSGVVLLRYGRTLAEEEA